MKANICCILHIRCISINQSAIFTIYTNSLLIAIYYIATPLNTSTLLHLLTIASSSYITRCCTGAIHCKNLPINLYINNFKNN